jgi:hypothetical protein
MAQLNKNQMLLLKILVTILGFILGWYIGELIKLFF